MIKTPIFITGRFRAGTSFLWHVFNQLEGCRAWYEPLHPQLLAAIDHVQPKADHVGIDDYWQVYRDHPDFRDFYSSRFATEKLYLEAQDEHPGLEAYINQLLTLSGDLTPVLQFNRVDLRLPWLKARFPEATIIHIKRHPLQLYHSQRKHIPEPQRNQVTHWDAYELPAWCFALADEFPIFSVIDKKPQHAFRDFYLLLQMSQLMARRHADITIDLELDVFQSDQVVSKISDLVQLSQDQKDQIKSLIHVPEPVEIDQQLSSEYARMMSAVDRLMMDSGLQQSLGTKPLAEIKSSFNEFWEPLNCQSIKPYLMLWEIDRQQQELTRLLAENDRLRQQIESTKQQPTAPHE